MTTLKFLRFQTELTHVEILMYLQNAKYDERTSEGFSIESGYNQQISGVFFNTITHTDKILDPLGNEIDTFYIVVEKTEFILDSRKKLLILINPVRSLKHFLTVLGVTLDYRISLQELNLDLLDFVKAIQQSRRDVMLSSIDIVGIPLSSHSIGKVSISGEEDVLKYANQYIGESSGSIIKRIRLSINGTDKQDRIDFLDSFTMRAGSIPKQKLLSFFFNELEGYLFPENAV